MKRASVVRDLLLGMALLVLAFCSQSAFAAGGHGGGGGGFHGGGGGFHGGGGGYHGGGFGGGYHGGGGYRGGGYGGGYHGAGYHGGGYGGGYRGGGWGGYRGGWNGYRAGWGYGYRGGWGYGGWGGWGCCGWGGWSFGISLNFGWPGWGWGYGYPYYAPSYAYYPYPYYVYPPTYPYYYAPAGNSGGYASPNAASDPAAYGQTADQYAAPAPYSQTGGTYQSSARYGQAGSTYQNPAPAGRPSAPTVANSLKLYNANYVSRPAASGTTSAIRSASYRPTPDAQSLAPLRPEVQNVMRAVQGMPPGAALRAIDSGRYNNLSPEELQLVREAAGLTSR